MKSATSIRCGRLFTALLPLVFSSVVAHFTVQAAPAPIPQAFTFSWNSGFANGGLIPDADVSGWSVWRTTVHWG
jgi:hypothetical protein